MHKSDKMLYSQNKASFIVLSDPYLTPITGQFMANFKTADQEYPKHATAKWKIESDHQHDEINLLYYSSIFPDSMGQACELDLYILPETKRRDYLIANLDWPAKIHGVIILVEAARTFVNNERWLNILDEKKEDPNFCAIPWAKWNQLPYVLVLVKEAGQVVAVSAGDLIRIFNLPPETPFISCPSGLNKENIQEILSVTLNHIKPNIP